MVITTIIVSGTIYQAIKPTEKSVMAFERISEPVVQIYRDRVCVCASAFEGK